MKKKKENKSNNLNGFAKAFASVKGITPPEKKTFASAFKSKKKD